MGVIKDKESLFNMRIIEVAAAIVTDVEGRILIAKRRPDKTQGGLWEFPGGKLEPGETPEACIRRELREEMDIEVEPGDEFGMNEHRYEAVHIRLLAYRAAYRSGSFRLTDHDEYRWVRPDELAGYAFAPADVPFVRRLMEEG